MATKMVMPLLGQTMDEGTIIKWYIKEGDTIKEGEPLLEVMTDKVNMEVEAPVSGVLRKIIAVQDDIVPVKDPICIIGTADESIDDLLGNTNNEVNETISFIEQAPQKLQSLPESAAYSSSASADIIGRLFTSPAARRVAKEKSIDINLLAGMGSGPNGRIVEKDVIQYATSAPKATPLAGKMAADMGINLSTIKGTGVAGKITSEDLTATTSLTPTASAEPLSIGSSIPFSGMRKAVAQNVSASAQTIPHVTLVSEIDMTECVLFRKQILADVEKRAGVRISFTDIIVKASARAIEDKPIVNSSLQGDKIVIHDRINIGIATALDGALVVPVVSDVQSKTLPQISIEIKALSARARAGQPKPEDFKNGTFSISNLGGFGVDSFNPIISPGQSAILGICRIVEKPVVVNGEIKIRSMMNLCLSFDHRVMDGAPAAEYLARLKEILESPYLIFM